MTIPEPKTITKFFSIFLLIVVGSIINSCRKDNKSVPQTVLPTPVAVAKLWYESSFPVNSSTNGKLVTQGVGTINTTVDLSQHIKPDWQHSTNYKRFGKDVIEMPIDPSGNIATALSNKPGGNAVYKKQYSRSSFILLNDGTNYEAYVMTIIADSAYLKNDLTKLGRNRYNKRDSDFSGVVLYSTPKGKFVSGWFYKNGNITSALSSLYKTYTTATSKNNGPVVQSLKTNLLQAVMTCTDWYQTYTIDGVTSDPVYLDTTCVTYSGGGGGSSGSTGGDGSTTGGGGGDGSGGGSGTPTNTGFPPPNNDPSAPTLTPIVLKIITDSLQKHFPCAVALIINNLANGSVYSTFIQAFTTSRKPDLTWQDGPLPWNAPTSNSTSGTFELGTTSFNGLSATITLNTSMLQNSSQLLIAAAAIHETLHAYINYDIEAGVGAPPSYTPDGSWLYSLDTWAIVNGLPNIYSSHYQMLSDYFSQAVTALAQFDNNAHTTKEYAEAMLFGLNQSNGTGVTPDQQALLQTEFNNLLTSYGLTAADLNTFNNKNLNATANKLPTSGC
ncbi:MAG: hypothetical protein JWQ84_1583 [Mucilaginibacter sp.]|nr:hypothetical protein [Mucilaginibacter sp.]